MRINKATIAVIFISVLTACSATGPLYSEMSTTIPPLPAGKGRIFFYRSDNLGGAAATSDIKLNGKLVGRSERASFFYVDEPPGNYVVSTSTEVERQLTFTLEAGETRYVHTYVSIGFFIGRINSQLENATNAMPEIVKLHYTGGQATGSMHNDRTDK